MSFSRNVPAGLISQGFQRIVTNSTATTMNSTCAIGTTFIFSVDGQNVRVTFDGVTTPTANTGILYPTGGSPNFAEDHMWDGIADATKIKFARVAAGAIINLQSFRRPSDKVSP